MIYHSSWALDQPHSAKDKHFQSHNRPNLIFAADAQICTKAEFGLPALLPCSTKLTLLMVLSLIYETCMPLKVSLMTKHKIPIDRIPTKVLYALIINHNPLSMKFSGLPKLLNLLLQEYLSSSVNTES